MKLKCKKLQMSIFNVLKIKIMVRNRYLRSSILFLIFVFGSVHFMSADTKVIPVMVRNNAAPSAVHAVKVLGRELKNYGVSINIIQRKSFRDGDTTYTAVYAGNVENYLNREMAYKYDYEVPVDQESYIIRIRGNNVFVIGSDEVGTMYGLYDLVEQIRWHGSMDGFPEFLKEKIETPYVKIRGINQFLHTQAIWNEDSWFFDMDFWEQYLDLLSFNRINFLDIHAVYDLYNTDFLNFFAYFVKSEKYPEVGLSKEVCERNLEMFKKVVHMAKERGIRTGLMNYNFGSYIGGQPGPGKFRGDPKVDFPRLNDKDLEIYIRDVTAKFLREIPELWTFGFRIGESGKRLDFFNDTFIKGIRESGREGMSLISRSWLSTRRLIDKMAADYQGKVFIEVKYNGEQFGVPYQAITGGKRPWHLSYSYEEYTDLPRKYDLIWQIRFNGDHRIFQWANAEYIKRTVRTMHFADGAGFSIEPMQSYYPYTDFATDIPEDKQYYKWGFQRDWLWNVMWGRLSYNPDEDERVYMFEMNRRFGEAADDVLKVVEMSSEVIPLIYQTHCNGVDHRAAAPELETGNGLNKKFKPDDINYDKGINSFIEVEPLDIGSFMTIREYVGNVLSGKESEKFTPVDVNRRLKDISDSINDALDAGSLRSLQNNAEFENYKVNAEMLSDLALYYSEKFMAATDLQFYYSAGDRSKLISSLAHAKKAYGHWKEMAETGKSFYHPFSDQLRMRRNDYTWESQLKFLQKDIDYIEGLVAGKGDIVFAGIGSVPVTKVKLNEAIPVSATLNVPVSEGVYVNYRRAGEKKFVQKKLEKSDGQNVFSGFLDKSLTKKAGTVEYYLSAKINGHDVTYRPFDRENPVRVVVSNDFTPPQFKHVPESPEGHPQAIKISVKVIDDSEVRSVRLYCKELPSYLLWKSVEMKPVGDGTYEAVVPLNKHGLMYRFAAEDICKNATIYPDPAVETPYFVIDAWE